MANRLKLYVDWSSKSLIRSNRNATPFRLPKFFQGDVLPMQIQIVEPDTAGGPNSFVVLPVAAMALRLGVSATPIGTSGSPTPFVTQYTWSKDTVENYFYANVAFNTAGLDTFLGAESEKTAYFELELTEDTAVTTILQEAVTIRADVVEASSLQVAPGATSLSLEVALQMFVKKFMDPGESITLPSADGTRRTVLYTHNDGSWHEDSL